jgi:hypothetical protein
LGKLKAEIADFALSIFLNFRFQLSAFVFGFQFTASRISAFQRTFRCHESPPRPSSVHSKP